MKLTRKEEEQRLLKRSSDFLETAEYQVNSGVYDLATFSLQQTLELFLKAKLLSHGVDYPRTHSLRELLKLLFEIAPESEKSGINGILQKHLLELGLLEDAYITSRYITREFSKEEVERLAKTVKETLQVVK